MDTPKQDSKMTVSTKLTKAAWRTLKLDKEILWAGILSMLVSLLLFALMIGGVTLIMYQAYGSGAEMDENSVAGNAVFYVIIGIFLFVSYAVANYFSGAVAHAALKRFRGEDPTLRGSLGASAKKIGSLTAYSGLQATVGLVLNIISDRLPIGGKIATWLVGAAWGIATMFAIPVIMDNKETRPLKTVRTSAITLKKVWGESAFIGIGLGLIEIVVTIVMMFILVGSVAISVVLSTWVYGAAAAAIFVLGIIAFGVVMSTLRTIIMTAAYYYASTDQLPAGFDDELIRSMFRPKRAWLK
jgi:hypothetical protein